MSYIYTVDVQCNVCDSWISGTARSVEEAKEIAIDCGWKFKDGKHTCVACQLAEKREAPQNSPDVSHGLFDIPRYAEETPK